MPRILRRNRSSNRRPLSYDQAVATRDSARSQLAQAKNQVAYTDLKAGQNGIVTAVSADVGQVVGAGTPVVTVAVDGEKEVLIAVPEMDIAQFKPGKAVKAGFWSDDTLTLDGKVREVAGSADPQSRTFAVRVSLPDDPRVLLGMTATVKASVGSKRQLVSIPLERARREGRTADRLDRRPHERHGPRHAPVKVADFTADGVSVAEGLKPGDVVVAAGTQFMTENLKVKLAGDTAQLSASADSDGAVHAAAFARRPGYKARLSSHRRLPRRRRASPTGSEHRKFSCAFPRHAQTINRDGTDADDHRHE